MKIFKNKLLRWFSFIIIVLIGIVSINLFEEHIGYSGMYLTGVFSIYLAYQIENYLIKKLSDVMSFIISLMLGLAIFGIASFVIISIQP